jgi:molecular chaperone DnaJ
MPYIGSHGKGDLLVRINVTVPKKINARQKELLKEFADISGESLKGEMRQFY